MSDDLSMGEKVHKALLRAADAKIKAIEARKLADRIYDRLLLEQEGSIAIREAKARVHERFIAVDDAAILAESNAILAKASADGYAIEFEQWRTNSATSRAEMNLR